MSRRLFPRVCTATAALVFASSLLVSGAAQAQTTVVLDAPGSEVVDTFVRGGSYANSNYNTKSLATRASSDAAYARRALIKFDTSTYVPKGAAIQSATLTVTVKGGNSETRTVTAYRVSESFDEGAATWNDRKSGIDWQTSGGSLGSKYASATVYATAGSKVKFDITRLVQDTVNGSYGSRYTRVALIDTGASSRDSYREYYDSEASDSSVRPRLTVVYGGSTTTTTSTTTTSTSTSGVTMRVLHWNLHHGVGTDGKYDINRIATWIAKENPDVVSLNEVEKYTYWGNEDQPARYKAMLESKTGRTWYMVWAQEYGQWTSNGKGNLLLSRYPLNSSARYLLSYSRTVALGQVTVNGRNITVATTHLDPDYASRRYTEAQQLMSWFKGFAQNRILVGDMNAQPTSTEMTYIKNQGYRDAWADAKSGGYAYSAPDNPYGYTRNSRIDILYTSTGATNIKPKRVEVVDTRDANGVMPSDHRPLLVVYSVQ